jgi:hypothetical protein
MKFREVVFALGVIIFFPVLMIIGVVWLIYAMLRALIFHKK